MSDKPDLSESEYATGEDAQGNERVLLEAVADLIDAQWDVRAEPVLGSFRPDMLISDKTGKAYVVEIKAGSSGAHFGSVAQVAAYQEAAAAALDKHVEAILVLAGVGPGEIGAVGEDFGVDVVSSETADPATIATLIGDRIRLRA